MRRVILRRVAILVVVVGGGLTALWMIADANPLPPSAGAKLRVADDSAEYPVGPGIGIIAVEDAEIWAEEPMKLLDEETGETVIRPYRSSVVRVKRVVPAPDRQPHQRTALATGVAIEFGRFASTPKTIREFDEALAMGTVVDATASADSALVDETVRTNVTAKLRGNVWVIAARVPDVDDDPVEGESAELRTEALDVEVSRRRISNDVPFRILSDDLVVEGVGFEAEDVKLATFVIARDAVITHRPATGATTGLGPVSLKSAGPISVKLLERDEATKSRVILFHAKDDVEIVRGSDRAVADEVTWKARLHDDRRPPETLEFETKGLQGFDVTLPDGSRVSSLADRIELENVGDDGRRVRLFGSPRVHFRPALRSGEPTVFIRAEDPVVLTLHGEDEYEASFSREVVAEYGGATVRANKLAATAIGPKKDADGNEVRKGRFLRLHAWEGVEFSNPDVWASGAELVYEPIGPTSETDPESYRTRLEGSPVVRLLRDDAGGRATWLESAAGETTGTRFTEVRATDRVVIDRSKELTVVTAGTGFVARHLQTPADSDEEQEVGRLQGRELRVEMHEPKGESRFARLLVEHEVALEAHRPTGESIRVATDRLSFDERTTEVEMLGAGSWLEAHTGETAAEREKTRLDGSHITWTRETGAFTVEGPVRAELPAARLDRDAQGQAVVTCGKLTGALVEREGDEGGTRFELESLDASGGVALDGAALAATGTRFTLHGSTLRFEGAPAHARRTIALGRDGPPVEDELKGPWVEVVRDGDGEIVGFRAPSGSGVWHVVPKEPDESDGSPAPSTRVEFESGGPVRHDLSEDGALETVTATGGVVVRHFGRDPDAGAWRKPTEISGPEMTMRVRQDDERRRWVESVKIAENATVVLPSGEKYDCRVLVVRPEEEILELDDVRFVQGGHRARARFVRYHYAADEGTPRHEVIRIEGFRRE